MKQTILTLVLTALASASAWADVTKEEIRRLLAAGVSEDVVLTFIRKNGPVARLRADDLVELKVAGAGDRVLAALLSDQAVPDFDLPLRSAVEAPPAGGVFGAVYVYDPMYRTCFPARSQPVAPLCTWGPTFTTVVPRCAPPVVSCRPCVPVYRPVCHPVVRSCRR